ncbi:uncharacterized protein Bfra_011859 [Botrytis fragariae]|uniref:Uncharacterized protein n=1 Tax=Botrytis fragariae TaxID=1964551 RepID=A0A8H6AK84_9HELO|nr:uncharacterized protein Bfra_011859 [Botrytis fragariae]KAF5868894.1 hypothetical protein Bfra_011859 [Botrytis fragariae]
MFVALRALQSSDPCCTRAYSPKVQERSFQQVGQAIRLSKPASRLWVSPRAWSFNRFTIPTTTSLFATCTASDHEWVSNVLNGYLNVSDEWIVHDKAGSPSLGRPEIASREAQCGPHGAAYNGIPACSSLASQPLSLSSLRCSRPHSPVYISFQVLCYVAAFKEGAQEMDVLGKGAVEQGNKTWRQEGKLLEEMPVFIFYQRELFSLASRLLALHLSITSEQSRAFSSDQENPGADDNI